jgi:uncharacterized protein YndB with AHSA1/START domain
MTERTVTHATFVVERSYGATPARVFAAWADRAAKARWFGDDDTTGAAGATYQLDFKVGGREFNRGGPPGGPVYTYEARYQDIVPNQRIVYTYDMHQDETRISVSVATVELKPAGAGTRLILTEQGAYLDGLDTPAQREAGTSVLLDALGAMLDAAVAPAPEGDR